MEEHKSMIKETTYYYRLMSYVSDKKLSDPIVQWSGEVYSALLAGSVVRFYDFPLYVWGTIMPNEMMNTAKYPTAVITIPSSIP
uniref:Complex I-B9 n=1 Tax=Ascaris lumbricoides TaxID=6252 RepID=A0A0M3ILQ2_ASCLU